MDKKASNYWMAAFAVASVLCAAGLKLALYNGYGSGSKVSPSVEALVGYPMWALLAGLAAHGAWKNRGDKPSFLIVLVLFVIFFACLLISVGITGSILACLWDLGALAVSYLSGRR